MNNRLFARNIFFFKKEQWKYYVIGEGNIRQQFGRTEEHAWRDLRLFALTSYILSRL